MTAIIDNVVLNVKLLKVDQTIDEEYNASNEKFEKLKIHTERIIKLLNSIDYQIKTLSVNCRALFTNVVTWAKEATKEQQKNLQSALNSSLYFEAITLASLITKTNPNVISLIMAYDEEVKKVDKYKTERNAIIKKYDKDRARVSLLEEQKNQKMDQYIEAKKSFDASENEYKELNQKFIEGVQHLEEIRDISLVVPYQNIAAIFCQYIKDLTTGPPFHEVEVKVPEIAVEIKPAAPANDSASNYATTNYSASNYSAANYSATNYSTTTTAPSYSTSNPSAGWSSKTVTSTYKYDSDHEDSSSSSSSKKSNSKFTSSTTTTTSTYTSYATITTTTTPSYESTITKTDYGATKLDDDYKSTSNYGASDYTTSTTSNYGTSNYGSSLYGGSSYTTSSNYGASSYTTTNNYGSSSNYGAATNSTETTYTSAYKTEFSSDSDDDDDYTGNPFAEKPKKPKTYANPEAESPKEKTTEFMGYTFTADDFKGVEDPYATKSTYQPSTGKYQTSNYQLSDDFFATQKPAPKPAPKPEKNPEKKSEKKPEKKEKKSEKTGIQIGKYQFVLGDSGSSKKSSKKSSYSSSSSKKSTYSSSSKKSSSSQHYDDDDGWGQVYNPGVVNKTAKMHKTNKYYEKK